MAAPDKFKHAETDANRVRKLNLLQASAAATALAGVAGVSVDAVESAGGAIRTVLTLTRKVITMTDATTAGCHGSFKLYDFPDCNLLFLGGTCDLTLTAAAGITATAAVVASVGTTTLSTTDATLSGTEADLIPSTAATLTGSAGTAKGKTLTAGVAVFDGTATAKDAWLNFAVPDAGATGNSTLTVSGTVTLVWSNLGDV